MAENLIISVLLTVILAVFIEFLLPWQTRLFYERVTRRPLVRNASSWNSSLIFKVPAYIIMAYLSYRTVCGDEVVSVILAAFVCLMGAISVYFKSLRFIFSKSSS